MRVSIIKAGSNRKQSLIEALDYLGGLDRFVLANDRIMLKPNLNGVEGCTDIALTEALLRLLLDKNARVVIAESTFGDAKMTDMFFLKSGYAELAKKYNVKLYNLNASQPIRVKVKNPQITDYLYLAREIFDTDKIINLPNLKVHYATGITLALKNLKGLLVGSEKKRFHDIGLDKAIVDLNNTIRPDLTIADAISCMEGMGPRGGDLVKMNLILAGQNSAAVDVVASKITGFGIEEVKHLKYYLKVNNIQPETIKTVGESIESVKQPLKKVNLENLIPGNFIIRQKNACSACMNALLLSIQLLPTQPEQPITVYLGDAPLHPDENGLRIGFGNCCPVYDGLPNYVRGCPPYPYSLGKVLEKVE